MNDLEKKIYDIACKHPEFDDKVVLDELKQIDTCGVTQDVYVLYQQLEKKPPGNKNVLESWVLYLLGTTTKKPEGQFALQKRRTYGRKGFPDIDMDFDYVRRHEIIEYLIEKYGRDYVGSIGTVQKLQTKAAIRRAIKVLDPAGSRQFDGEGKEDRSSKNENFALENAILDEIDAETMTVGGKLRTRHGSHLVDSVRAAYNHIPGFKRYMDAYPEIAKYASRVEGSVSAFGAHAAGFLISPIPLEEICPLHYTQDTIEVLGEDESSEKTVATQWVMGEVEAVGLLKMDILGLSTKTAISWAVESIKLNHGVDIDIRHLPLDDKETLNLIRAGKTAGCFQLESSGMQDAIKKINITNFVDLVITIAMFRPGPMEYIPELADRKSGRKKIAYDHPLMETVTKSTYGIICFQEQLMQVFMSLAGMTASDGYDFMKGCAKKNDELIAKYQVSFVKECMKNGVDERVVNKVWADMKKFGGYAFNAAHATSYAYESWKTCYLKAHYPTEFIQARLSVENIRRQFDLVAKYELDAIRNYGFKILLPDINKSKVRYSIEGDRILRKPLLLKGIGLKAATEIVNHQPYRGSDILWSFGMSVGKQVNTKVMEAMYDAKLWPDYNRKTELIRSFEQIKKDKRDSVGKQTDDLFA